MTGNESDLSRRFSPDPRRLRERGEVEYTERTVTHEDDDHCGAEAAGRAIVGVTNDRGEVLLIVDERGEHAFLPNGTFDADDHWPTVARDTAAAVAGEPVALGEPRAVRRVEHVADGDDEPHNTTFQVVVGGSVDGEVDPGVDAAGVTAGWFDELPVPADDERGNATADVRRFLG